MSPRKMKWLINLWPPYLGAGIKVEHIAPDYRRVEVSLRMRWYNRNYVGTHFGGSLFAMADPFYMLMLMQILGRDYYVWDKSAHIDFVSPGKGKVTALFLVTDEVIEAIQQATASGDKYLPELLVLIHDEQGNLVARVSKQLYIKRKPPKA
ncbi:acyl-coenzyme A thioesterase PaaI-like protein [Chitinivorax tropicus]|uniref:Acyl-coenzyme A thioesterase PaaI-like protein n=1 Tax=Chitinivorax tropicus TaxID=714531 RepID=A0A840MMR7_9PROT|nr:DUF4442 domain-containing protein [Chitinivorax tropicus]MBB5019938.1 acyl-coenzyme A thioesterase PaaI-like protein [Chitinivorax tropicus]